MSKTPETLTITESHQLIESLLFTGSSRRKNRLGIRNYLFTLFMLDAGLRVGEVVQLFVTDIFQHEEPVNALVIRQEIAKGKSQRIIPLSSRLKAAISEYNERLLKYIPTNDQHFVFYTYKLNAHITTRQVERIIKTASRKAIGREIYPHVLRHTFASRLMRQVNSRIVQELLGHKNLSTTQIYTHPNNDDLTNAINSLTV